MPTFVLSSICTTARYYTPAERSIQALGITPDIVVDAAQRPAPEARPAPLREADLAGHLENDATDADADAKPGRSALAARDYQIGEALNLLKGMSLVADRQTTDGG